MAHADDISHYRSVLADIDELVEVKKTLDEKGGNAEVQAAIDMLEANEKQEFFAGMAELEAIIAKEEELKRAIDRQTEINHNQILG